jgi:hypothetical protein
MANKKLTKTELLCLEKYVENLDKEVGLKPETLKEIKYKITIHYRNAPD